MVNQGCKTCAELMRRVVALGKLHLEASREPQSAAMAPKIAELVSAKERASEEYQGHLLSHRTELAKTAGASGSLD